MLNKLRAFLPTHFWHGKQKIVILAVSFVGLVAILGLITDFGLVYIERVRLNQAVDSAVLAAAPELPFEEDAMQRAIEYLKQNGYEVGKDVDVLVRGCVTTKGGNIDENNPGGVPQLAMLPIDEVKGAVYIPIASGETKRTTFMIDTGSFRGLEGTDNTNENPANLCNSNSGDYGNSSRIKIIGESFVDMNFMKWIGFSKAPIISESMAESVSNLDVMIVLDVSTSTEVVTPYIGGGH